MDKNVKKISAEKLEYYRNHIYECPVDILRVLYAEKEESEKYLYDAYQDAGKKMFEFAEKCEKLERQIKIKDKYLELMWFIGADYDGYETPEGLKSVIDELVQLSLRAGANDDKYAMYDGCGNKYYNILYEEVPPAKEEEYLKNEEN